VIVRGSKITTEPSDWLHPAPPSIEEVEPIDLWRGPPTASAAGHPEDVIEVTANLCHHDGGSG